MGLFSKKPQLNPTITVEGIEIAFHRDGDWWEFTYRGAPFHCFGMALSLPTKAQLDSVLETVEALKPEMKNRLLKGLSEWGDAKVDDGESCCIDVQDYADMQTFTVSWSDGASWGDLGVDFTVKDHAIIDESWGD